MPPEPEDDLHWTAFRYVAGELSTAEASAFERRLDDDQDAREAVAAAVELAGALAIAAEALPIEFAGPTRRAWVRARRVLAGSALAAAAALLVIVLGPAPRPGRTPTPGTGPSDVARAWLGLRVAPDAEWTAIVAEAPAGDGPESLPTADADAGAERPLPSWMLAAASALTSDIPRRQEN